MNGTGNKCTARFNCTMPGTFSDTNHELVFGASKRASLTVPRVTSCGLLHAGDKLYYAGSYAISKPSELRISAR